MNSPCCHSDSQRFGKDRRGNQRFRCRSCRKTYTEPRKRLIGDMRIPLDRAELIVRLLCEGNSIRSVERITIMQALIQSPQQQTCLRLSAKWLFVKAEWLSEGMEEFKRLLLRLKVAISAD